MIYNFGPCCEKKFADKEHSALPDRLQHSQPVGGTEVCSATHEGCWAFCKLNFTCCGGM